MSVSIKASNGVGFTYTHTVTAAEQSAGSITFDFNSPFTISAIIFVLAETTGAVVAPTGQLVTYPAVGQVKIANGGALTLTAGQTVVIVGGIVASV